MSDFSRLIFLCTENTCLSVMAEAILVQQKRDEDLDVMSRGLIVLFPEPVNAKADTVLKEHGLKPLIQEARGLETRDLSATTLVLTMTGREKYQVMEKFPMANFVYTLREFVGESGDLEEPCGPIENYEACYQHILALVTKISTHLFKEDAR